MDKVTFSNASIQIDYAEVQALILKKKRRKAKDNR